MVLNKFTGSTLMDGTEKSLFKIVGTTMKHFASYVYLKALQAGESVRIRVYNKVDDVSHWKLDGDVTDSVASNNGTITNVGSWQSQWKFDGDVLDSVGSNNGTITYNTNLKRLYKFESNVNDSTPSAANGTVTGTTTFVTGREGKAFSFDGSSYITASDTGLPTGNNAVSMSCWVNSSVSSVNQFCMVYGTPNTNQLFGFRIDNTNVIVASTQTYILATGTTSIKSNTWYHVAVTWDGTTCKIYVNGILDVSATPASLNLTLAGASGLVLGEVSGTQKLTGMLDECRTYNVTLTQAQVSALYMNGKFAQSHTFDNGEYVSKSSPSGIPTGTSDRTIAFWINPANFTTNASIFQYGANTGNNLFGINMTDTAGHISAVGSGNDVAFSTPLVAGIWNQVVIVLSSSGTVRTCYINGVQTAQSTTTALNTTASTFFIGSDIAGTSTWNGQLDEFRVYSSALSASQVLGLYNYTGSNYVTPLPVGNALSLDGASYVTVNNTTPYNFERTNAFSMSCWIKPGSLAANQAIMGKFNGVHTQGYYFWMNTSGKIIFDLTPVTNTPEGEVISATALSIGTWYNVIVTYDGSSNQNGMKIYINGVLDQTGAASAFSSSILNSNNFVLGAASGGSNKFTGLIDEAQVFNYVVSSAEINAINAGRFANTHPIGLWHFDGDLYDYSGQGSIGSPTGTMTYVTGALSGSYNVPNTHFNFDGSEYVDAGNVSNLNFERTQPFSVAFWIRTTNSSNQSIVNKFLSVNTGWTAGIQTNLNLQLANTNNSNDFTSSSSTSVIDGLWHFCVITYDGSSNPAHVKFYVDSVLGATNVGRNNLTGSILNTGHVVIGALDTSANNPVVGEIDDLRVYNRALSSAEVSDLYTYPDSAMKQLIYDKSYTGIVPDAKFVVWLPGNQNMVTVQQTNGTNRIISWEREEVS